MASPQASLSAFVAKFMAAPAPRAAAYAELRRAKKK